MWKEHKQKLILSSILILVPMVIGFLLWNQLPDTMIRHWGIDGTADGYSTKLVVITVPFLLMLAVHWFCLFFTSKDMANKEQNSKVKGMVFWMIPIVSILAGGIIYSAALGMEMEIGTFITPYIGILFIFIGNYLPKCRQNRTIGIKIYWTLVNEENWNATHRFGGKTWVAGGFAMLLAVFLPRSMTFLLMFAGIFALVILPILYSYCYYLKQKKDGTWKKDGVSMDDKEMKLGTMISLVIAVPILLVVSVILFTGDIDYKYGEKAFTVEADFWSDITVKYENIKEISYREDVDFGSRNSGFGSMKLGMGTFENEEFGFYTRYCYESCQACVVLEVGNKMLVVNGKDEKVTKEIYETLQEKVSVGQ